MRYLQAIAAALSQAPITLWISLFGLAISVGALLRTIRLQSAETRQKLATAVDGVREHAQRHLYLAELMTLTDISDKPHSGELELDDAYREFKSKQTAVGDSFVRQFCRFVAPRGTAVTERSLYELRGDRPYDAAVAAEVILSAIWNADLRSTVSRHVAQWRDRIAERSWDRDRRFCAANLGQPHSGFAAYTDRTPAGLLEVLVPGTTGLRHCYRDMKRGRWECMEIDCKVPAIDGVSLLQSNFGSGNLEVIVRMGNRVRHIWAGRAEGMRGEGPSGLHWHVEGRPDLVARTTDDGPADAIEVGGHPAFIQSIFGGRGNFEIIAPGKSRQQLRHFWRTNDTFDRTWKEERPFPRPTRLRFDAAAMVHVRSPIGIRGTLEVIVRAGHGLYHFRRIPYPPWGRWEPVPRRLRQDVGPTSERDPSAGLCFEHAAGVPAVMQVRTRSTSVADPIYLATPRVGGGIVLLQRRGDDPSFAPWEDEQIVDEGVSADAVSIVQVDIDGAVAVLAIVGSEVYAYRQSKEGRWRRAD